MSENEPLGALLISLLFLSVPFVAIATFIGTGLGFIKISQNSSSLNKGALAGLYVALAATFIWLITSSLFSEEYSPITLAVVLLPIATILTATFNWVLLRCFKMPAWLEAFVLVLGFWGFVICLDPVRTVLLDKWGFNSSLKNVAEIYIVPSLREKITLTVPRPYFLYPADKYNHSLTGNFFLHLGERFSANSISDVSLYICYPSMQPWHFGCRDKNNWPLLLNIPKADPHISLNVMDFIRSNNDIADNKQYTPAQTIDGLRVYKASETTATYDTYGAFVDYIPTNENVPSFFYNCTDYTPHEVTCRPQEPCPSPELLAKIRATQNIQCLRKPLSNSQLSYSYLMPAQALNDWHNVETKVANFISALNPKEIAQ